MVKPGTPGTPEKGVSGTKCLNFAVSLRDGGGYHLPGTSKGRHALTLPPRNPNLPKS